MPNAMMLAVSRMTGIAARLSMKGTCCAEREGAPLKSAPRTAIDHYSQISALLDAELADTSPDGRIPRAVLGRYVRNVNYFGENWLRANMRQLFPSDDPMLRDAAWSGHLLNDAGPLSSIMPGLVQSYEDEIGRLSQTETNDEKFHRANRLSEYLVILFVHGVVPIELMERFWKAASDRLRQHAMWFLGHLILAAKDIGRFRRFQCRPSPVAAAPEAARRQPVQSVQCGRRGSVPGSARRPRL